MRFILCSLGHHLHHYYRSAGGGVVQLPIAALNEAFWLKSLAEIARIEVSSAAVGKSPIAIPAVAACFIPYEVLGQSYLVLVLVIEVLLVQGTVFL